MEYNQRLDELKKMILSKSGIRFITPADCKRISIEISRRLNKNVSETTIKRLFGFARVKHKFSTFTLTTISEYVDMVIPEPVSILPVHNKEDEWYTLKEKADKITAFTLKTIRNRSGIPYDMTIGRKFAEHDFETFYNGNYIFTSLISQPGYGKTILLSHLAEDMFYGHNAPYKNSTLLFIKAYSFFNKESISLNLEEQLRTQLQIEDKENILEYINTVQSIHGGKFVIMIDGFAELIIKKEDKNILFDSIINLICSLEDCKNIKLMMSMRSTTWTRFYDRMRHSSFLKSTWFPGGNFNLQELSNVPTLSEREVDIIITKINYLDTKQINPRLKAQLKFPFHIQLYYQLKEEDPGFNYYTNITFFELVSRFIQEKIYRSNYYTEKILFLKKVIQLTDYGKKSNYVEKDSLLAELFNFRNAYMELLADGILMEEKRSDKAHPKEFVRFLHPHMFEYFLFVEILEKFHLQVNQNFFTYIYEEYDYNQVRFQLLQWTIRFLIKTANFQALKLLFSLNLGSFETNYLILFIAEEIKYRSKYNPDIIKVMEEDKFHDVIISKLINFDFIDSCYKEAVTTLISIAKHNDHLLTYNSLLGILAIIRLDKEGINQSIANLSLLNADAWMINPVEALQIIYSKINAEQPAQSNLLKQIEQFKKGQNPFIIESAQLDTKQGISHLLMLFINLFMGDDDAGNQIISNLIKLNPKDFLKRSTFTIYILAVYAMYNSKIAGERKTVQIENIIGHLATRNTNFTKYQESVLLMFQAQQHYHKKHYEIAIDYAKECLANFKRNDLVLNAMFMFNLIIRIYTEMENFDMVNEYKYEKLCLLDEHQIARQFF